MLLVETPLTGEEELADAKLALFDIRTPSTSMAVPKAGLPASEEAPRRIIDCSLVSRGLVGVAPPGRRLEISATFII